jgi:hypothetical protein
MAYLGTEPATKEEALSVTPTDKPCRTINTATKGKMPGTHFSTSSESEEAAP